MEDIKWTMLSSVLRNLISGFFRSQLNAAVWIAKLMVTVFENNLQSGNSGDLSSDQFRHCFNMTWNNWPIGRRYRNVPCCFIHRLVASCPLLVDGCPIALPSYPPLLCCRCSSLKYDTKPPAIDSYFFIHNYLAASKSLLDLANCNCVISFFMFLHSSLSRTRFCFETTFFCKWNQQCTLIYSEPYASSNPDVIATAESVISTLGV